ncbi:uncharacterized protein G2W53_036273 [Senna tora]|uniref:Uncharacterized protein n=1 Tax=Senna tora TaxID=362788 RepID=A0A834SSG8_9FABA|nr:uncharacterized protein G2W53_036273 [Senna tora]
MGIAIYEEGGKQKNEKTTPSFNWSHYNMGVRATCQLPNSIS